MSATGDDDSERGRGRGRDDGGGEQLVFAGQFTYGHDVWFFGVGETTVRGN